LKCIEVSAPSHVHVGNIDIHGGLGRLYGTLGFALRRPRFRAKVCPSDEVEVVGSKRSDLLEAARRASRLGGTPVRVEVAEEIPPHVGLGSTTPAYTGIAHAAAILAGKEANPRDIAYAMGRARVSGLGLYSYIYGGFLVDGGYRSPSPEGPPPLIFRRGIPGDLVVVYAVPSKPLPGILELKAREEEILGSLPPMPEEQALRNSRLVVMGIMPSAAEGDWESFGVFLTRFNRGLGEYWAREQGGEYCCSEVEEIAKYMLGAGGLCACQSSWGPTVYALTPRDKVSRLLEGLRELVDSMGGGLVGSSRVDNYGAVLRVAKG